MLNVPGNSHSLIQRARLFSRPSAIFAILAATVVLAGWQFDVTALKSIRLRKMYLYSY